MELRLHGNLWLYSSRSPTFKGDYQRAKMRTVKYLCAVKKTSRTLFLLYLLLGYVFAQFAWWGYSIYSLNRDIAIAQFEIQSLQGESPEPIEDVLNSKLYMVVGEGVVFLVLLLFGAYFLSKYIAKNEQMTRRERNFLMATTHEFNSPLAAMKLNLQTLIKRDLDSDQLKNIASSALQANQRLENLVSNILVASRLDTGKLELLREKANLHDIIFILISQFKPLAEQAKSELVFTCPEDLEANVDRAAVQSILSNLIENALKYAPGPVSIKAMIESDYLALEVGDLGPGIPAEQRALILKKFYRIENEETRTQKGTGLGLYIVAQLTHEHGGKLRIEENQPTGTRFTAKLKLR